MRKRPQFLVGIDCGVNTGYALYDRSTKQLIEVKTLTFWRMIDQLTHLSQELGTDAFEVFIEDVEQLRPTFNKVNASNRGAREKISQNVGSVKRDCQLLKEWMEKNQIKYSGLVPGKHSRTKMEVEQFKLITRWQGSSSTHGRDAALLVFGR